MRLLILLISFRYIKNLLGNPRRTSEPQKYSAEFYILKSNVARRIGQQITTVSYFTPWYSTCLTQAFTCRWMLQCRGIKVITYIGVKQEEGKMHAHAWTKYGQTILTGEKDIPGHQVISHFS